MNNQITKLVKSISICAVIACTLTCGNAVKVYAEVDNTIASVGTITPAATGKAKPATITLNDGAVVSIEEYERATGKEYVVEENTNQTVNPTTTEEVARASSLPPVSNAGLITVDLVIFAGQSNMSGNGGDAKEAPAVPNGHGYEFRNDANSMGLYPAVEPFGVTTSGFLADPAGIKLGSLVSSFMNTYYNRTGIPVMGISASVAGTSVNYWMEAPVQYDLTGRYEAAKNWCAANNVKIRHQYVVWLQGETDAIAGMSAGEYQDKLKKVFATVCSKGVEQVFIITIGKFRNLPGVYDTIVTAQKDLCAKDSHFTLATDLLYNLPEASLVDDVHYNQAALNRVGAEAATTVATFSRR